MPPPKRPEDEGYVAIPRELLERWRAAVREQDRRMLALLRELSNPPQAFSACGKIELRPPV